MGRRWKFGLSRNPQPLFSRAPSQEIFEYPARGKRCTASGGIIESAKLLNFLPAYSLPRMPYNRTFLNSCLRPKAVRVRPRDRRKNEERFFSRRVQPANTPYPSTRRTLARRLTSSEFFRKMRRLLMAVGGKTPDEFAQKQPALKNFPCPFLERRKQFLMRVACNILQASNV